MDNQRDSRSANGAARRSGRPRVSAPARRGARVVKPAVTDLAAKGLAPKPGSHAIKAQAYGLPPDATASEAFCLTLQHGRWHVLANIPAVVEAREVEGVHQLRVALRRLRVALAAFGKEFRTPAIEALRMRAKILAQGLAPARDMDVFLDDLFEPAAAANGSLDAFGVLRERASKTRGEAWRDAVRETSGLAFRTFLHDLGEVIETRQWEAQAPDRARAVFDRPVRELAERMLDKRLKTARKRAKKLEKLSEAQRHELRIALKKMRYSVDFFASLYPEDEVRSFQKRLSEMQDILGLLQDVAVARSTLKQLVEEPDTAIRGQRADLSFAAGIVYGWHLDRASSAWKDAVRSWKRFSRTDPFWASA